MLNILTIDLEDYYMVSAFEGVVKREDWDKFESRIERNTHRLLDILNGSFRTPNSELRTPVRATFFCLGWVAERYPHLIKEIHKQGHEIASHGYDHRLVYSMTPGQFREDIRKAKSILEDIIREGVIGYRAPTYSITQKSQWAFEVLIEEGFKYDSSIFPIRHDLYGYPNSPRFPFVISMNGNNTLEFKISNVATKEPKSFRTVALSAGNSIPAFLINSTASINSINSINAINGTSSPPHNGLSPDSELRTPNCLLEFPMSTIRMVGINLPISGGGYFRFFPYSLIKKGLRRVNEEEGQHFIFYIHPWETDPNQPRLNSISLKSRFRHYINLDKTATRFKKLLKDFNFSSIKEVMGLNNLKNSSNPTNPSNSTKPITPLL